MDFIIKGFTHIKIQLPIWVASCLGLSDYVYGLLSSKMCSFFFNFLAINKISK